MKILVFGASGSGTTTLGHGLSLDSSLVHLDADDYYWVKTDPPYTEKVPLDKRNRRLREDFDKHEHVVVSGSLISWGHEWTHLFDLAVFIYLSPDIRIERLIKREQERYGDLLQTDNKRKENYEAFIAWAKLYDDPDITGRSLRVHNDWIKKLDSKILRLDGALPLEEKVNATLKAMGKL